MGAPVTQYTALGKRAKPIRKRVRHLVEAVRANPPEGVGTHDHGSRLLSPRGYLAQSLCDFAINHSLDERPEDVAWFTWENRHVATSFLSGFCKGGSGHHNKLNVIEAWLPEMEAKFAPEPVSAPVCPPEPEPAPEPTPEPQEPEKPAQSAAGDPEIAALYAISGALDALEGKSARQRVLAWAGAKYGA